MWASLSQHISKAVEIVKHDLVEFTETVPGDLAQALQETTGIETAAGKEAAARHREQDADAMLSDQLDDLELGAAAVTTGGGSVPASTLFAASSSAAASISSAPAAAAGAPPPNNPRARLRQDIRTYTEAPDSDAFRAWVETFEGAGGIHNFDHRDDMDECLADLESFRLYKSLVPNEVSLNDFWQRYLWKLQQLTAPDDEDDRGDGGGRAADGGADGGGERGGGGGGIAAVAAAVAGQDQAEQATTGASAASASAGAADAQSGLSGGDTQAAAPAAPQVQQDTVVPVPRGLPPATEDASEEWELWE